MEDLIISNQIKKDTMKKLIGTVTIGYNNDGKPNLAVYRAEKYQVGMGELDKLKEMTAANNPKDAQAVCHIAQTVLAGYFNKVSELELADREKYEIVPEIKTCEKYPDGKVQVCVIDFYFQEVKVNG
jgi:hypothetical protein